MKSNIYLSVVVTALNEENNVENCIRRLSLFLEKYLENHEIIFVNDGSTDKTKETLDSLTDVRNLKIIHLPKNVGTGGAIKKAIPQISGDWYCWLPSDLEIPPEELIGPLRYCSGNDVVVTHLSNGRIIRTSFRHWLSIGFTFLMNKAFSHNLKYFNGVSLIKASLLKEVDIKADRFFFHAELLLKVLEKTKKYEQVAISLMPRQAGTSKAMSLMVFLDVFVCFTRNFWELRVISENTHN